MSSAGWARVRMAIVLIVGLVLETSLGGDLRLAGVAPDLMLLLAICAGLTGGPEAGAIGGFVAGFLADLSLTSTPVGLSAMTWCLVGWGVGLLRATVLPEGKLVQPAVALLATVSGVALFVFIGDLVGQSQLLDTGRTYVVRVALVEGLWSAVLIIPVHWVYARAARGSSGVELLSSVGELR